MYNTKSYITKVLYVDNSPNTSKNLRSYDIIRVYNKSINKVSYSI